MESDTFDTFGYRNGDERLRNLEDQERVISTRRIRLHRRIAFLRTYGNAEGSPVTIAQLVALETEEQELSAARRTLHAQIDALRGKA